MRDGWRKYTKKEIDNMKSALSSGKHVLDAIHTLPGPMKNFILKQFAAGLDEDAGFGGTSEAVLKAFKAYYFETLLRPGMIDYAQ